MTTSPIIEFEIEDSRKPIWTPLLSLLRSRKFILTLAALLVEGAIYLEPSFEPLRGQVAAVIALLTTFLVGSIAYEDRASIAADANQIEPQEINDLVLEIVSQVIDEINQKE